MLAEAALQALSSAEAQATPQPQAPPRTPEPEVLLELAQGKLKAQIARHNTPDALVTPRGRPWEL